MTTTREQRTVAKKVDDALKKALVASANYEAAQADFMRVDADAKKAKDIAKQAKSDARKADAVYLEAIKGSLAIDKAAYAAGKRSDQKTAGQTRYPLSGKDDDDNEGYVCDENGEVHCNPEPK